jgi:hypothetical protein
VPSTTTPDRELVRAFSAAPEPGMRKLIVGMLTLDAWDERSDAEIDADHADVIDISARLRPCG